jgi:hypothetical protein
MDGFTNFGLTKNSFRVGFESLFFKYEVLLSNIKIFRDTFKFDYFLDSNLIIKMGVNYIK